MKPFYITPQPMLGEKQVHLFLLFIVCFFAFFLNNHVIPADLMEARNLATAHEMNSMGNHLVPTLNGELRLAKPPLPTWIASFVDLYFPDSLTVQRGVAGAVATLMVVFLYLITSYISRKHRLALLAALVFASSYNIIMMGRTATWDIFCHSFMLGGIYFFIRACEQKGKQWGNFLLAGLFAGLSFLSKGPVSLYALFLPFLLAYLFAFRPMLKGKKAPIIAMLTVGLLVSFWWISYVFIFHHEEFVSIMQVETSAWINHNTRPWYYYWQFPAEAGIWASFWVTTIFTFFLFKRQLLRKEYAFSLLWFLFSLVLLSVIPEKKPRYLLPLLVPGAMSISFFLYYCWEGLACRAERRFFRANGTLIAIVLFLLPFAIFYLYNEGLFRTLPLTLILAGVLFWVLAGFIIYSLYRDKKKIMAGRVIACIIGAMMVVEAFCIVPLGEAFINPQRKSIKEVRNQAKTNNLPFYYNEEEELRIELVYESGKIIRPINTKNREQLMRALPFILVESPDNHNNLSSLPVSIEVIGVYDNNWNSPNARRYNKDLVRKVSVIREKK